VLTIVALVLALMVLPPPWNSIVPAGDATSAIPVEAAA
jgi:hypothetical protein